MTAPIHATCEVADCTAPAVHRRYLVTGHARDECRAHYDLAVAQADAQLRATPDEQPQTTRARVHPIGVGMPGWLLLNEFGALVHLAFGERPYLVGSALARRDPHDIDVRLVLLDDDFHRLFQIESLNQPRTGWAAMCLVWSHYGTHLVGKPIDFQITCHTSAIQYAGQPRLPLGVSPLKGARE